MRGEGVKRKERAGGKGVLGLENAFELAVTCRLTRSSCVNRPHGGAAGEKKKKKNGRSNRSAAL